jgi:adenylylsulfate kinase-like enzyme
MLCHGRIVLFTGPAAAGKSTIAAAWAASRVTATASFDHDQARFLVRSGSIVDGTYWTLE